MGSVGEHERIEWVDIAKGIGIILVVIGHIVTYGSDVFLWIYSFHMPLFFFLSGFVYKSKGIRASISGGY